MLFKRLSIALTIVVTMLLSIVNSYALDIYLGGQSIGIELKYDGVMISGTYDISIDNKKYNPSSNGFLTGDMIMKVNGEKIDSISTLMQCVEKEIENNHEITLTILRNNQELNKELVIERKGEKFSTGLYVQDGLSGIGTMTYYNPATHRFGALGHIMADTTLSSDIAIKQGTIYESSVKKIKPSENGTPGEKIAEIQSATIGTIYDNNNYGIYGSYQQLPSDVLLMSTASRDEIEEGDAYFLTVLDKQTISKCPIKITHLKKQSKPDVKGITFEITDEKVLSLTNGIVQGMSGSPIIQNNKIIGCVTHVDVHNVHKGYGLYIDWMLENDK